MKMKKNLLAVISDIHGNRWALEAVLEDIRKNGVKEIVNLGDVLYGPLDPAGTANLLIGKNIPTVQGNEDRLILDESSDVSKTLEFVRDVLQPTHLDWLKTFKPTLTLNDIILFHGEPGNDTNYLLHEVKPTGVIHRDPEVILAVLRSIPASLVICGHDHIQNTVTLPGGKMIVNPGSVGCPAFSDNKPYPHVMETGTPHARYTILERTELGWKCNQRSIDYDWYTAADEALKNGRSDWAKWLSTGFA